MNYVLRSACSLTVVGLFSVLAQGADVPAADSSGPQSGKMITLFDGKSLGGWIQEQPAPSIKDLDSLAKQLAAKSNAPAAFVAAQLDETAKSALEKYDASDADSVKKLRSALVKTLRKIIAGPTIYDEKRFADVKLRDEAKTLRTKNPQDSDMMRFNRVLLEDAFPTEIAKSEQNSWIVKDGAMASTGDGRGVIYTKDDFTKYRLMFTMRQVKGNHQPCVLIFCTRPKEGEPALDALGGIQFQVPNGGHWDYRPGFNKAGDGFKTVVKPGFDNKQWSRVEILVNATKGSARMAVANPADSKAIEVLDYSVPEAGKTGPIAWQMHNGGIFDEYKDVTIEIDPAVDDLVTVK